MNSTRPETTKPLKTCRSSSFPLGTFSGTKNLLNHNFPNLLNILIVLIPSVTSTRRPFPTGAWTTSLGTTTLARTPKGKIRCLRCCKRSCSRTIQGVESGVCNILFSTIFRSFCFCVHVSRVRLIEVKLFFWVRNEEIHFVHFAFLTLSSAVSWAVIWLFRIFFAAFLVVIYNNLQGSEIEYCPDGIVMRCQMRFIPYFKLAWWFGRTSNKATSKRLNYIIFYFIFWPGNWNAFTHKMDSCLTLITS